MEKSLLEKYIDKIWSMDDKEYLFGAILYHIAPTLISGKPACIITLNDYERNLNLLWKRYRKDFIDICELSIYEMREQFGSKTLFIYDEKIISEIIHQEENIRFLEKLGYNRSLSIEKMLEILGEKYKYFCPHEMGIFLGFPVKDVICFMEYPYRKCLLSGYWKVYNDIDFAMKKFVEYDTSKNMVINSILDGELPSLVIKNTIKQLIMH
ncbi:DUF3793 family protein [Clostridiaceae bacterium UIB06]|uniref:DUF3793 family protein n=1 Tax=Clostridium thailandense TaxID=2794346 RepID=A0A949U2P9_9CLOT|nr:DUF3793 family protein [Clostridium thailandense]MBV7275264.1 DUF3793 family protein [Clostridium thailandense]MCH5137775.1 DUF3793 family protein [Clostridiaceae bacterium UIB06]